MGLAYEVISGRAVNPGAALTALTMNAGDTLNVRDFADGSAAYLEDVWSEGAANQTIRIRSPKMHDSSNGLRLRTFGGSTRALLPHEAAERLYSTDLLTVETTGGGAETDTVALMLYYQDLPGQQSRLVTWEEIKARIAHVLALQVSVVAPAVAGTYSAATPIDANNNALKANTDYAILGYLVDSQCTLVGFRGVDFGNLRLGGPGGSEADDTREWFIRQSLLHSTPHIPIFGSNNKGAVLVDVAKVALTTTEVTAILAELT